MPKSRGQIELEGLMELYPLAGLTLADAGATITEKINRAYGSNYSIPGFSGASLGGTQGGATGIAPGTQAPGSVTNYGFSAGNEPTYTFSPIAGATDTRLNDPNFASNFYNQTTFGGNPQPSAVSAPPNTSSNPNINGNLQPGSTGSEVKKLQDWLVSQGYMTQAQVNTGYGTYGPQTKAAVAAWQSANNINTQGNPGYFGPISQQWLQQNSGNPTTPTNPATPGTPGVTGSPTYSAATPYGSPQIGYFANYQDAVNAADRINSQTTNTTPPGTPPTTTQTQPTTTLTPTTPTSPTTGSPTTPDLTGLTPELQALYTRLEEYLARLEQQGQSINPNITITPEQIAEFTHQAEGEINPYYSSQLQLARENLLRTVGYSTNEILEQERTAAQKYQKNFRKLGETFADTGFAQSGLRNVSEGDLASETQSSIDSNRRKLEFGVGDLTRSFAQQYGTPEVPQFNIAETPQFGAGEKTASFGSGSRSLYSLDPSVYGNLVGSQEFNRRSAVSNRASQLESAFRTNQALQQQRTLTL